MQVWSLTSTGPMVETRHMSNLSMIAKQALAQATTIFTSKEKQQLAIGLLDCLISITGESEGLKVLMQTEDGKEVLEDKLLGGHLCNRACPCGAWHDALGQCAIC